MAKEKILTEPVSLSCDTIGESEARLQLFPLPGEVEAAYAKAEMSLCGEIRDLLGDESKVPVYYGAP